MRPWIGVDLDGTLAEYHTGDGIDTIGPPIGAMVMRVQGWLARGREVRIMTARVSPASRGDSATAIAEQRQKIADWTQEHIGVALLATCEKDFGMIELWDDRAVQVIPNTGARADGES
jgi:hypothetical protein